jgi:GlnD PII-uridylyltransferase
MTMTERGFVLDDRPLTFDPCFKKLGREIAHFANHTRKLVRASHKHRPILLEAAEWSEGAAPLDRRPDDPARAMAAIDKFARSRRADRTTLIGAYFAHHHLRIQAESSRELLRESFRTDPGHRAKTCHRIYHEAYEQRWAWISSLLDLSINASAPDLSREDYAAFNVGSLADHEDVDLAIVAASPEAQGALSRAFTAVSKTFLRYASKIQLFLTEQFETPRTGALLEEYEQVLDRQAERVVSATQLLNAEHLCGSQTLARALFERVTSRFFAGQGSPYIHEAYLRAVMGELGHHLLPSNIPGVLSPKREVYVPAKLVIAAVRVIHGIREARPPETLAVLAEKDPEHAEVYATLSDAFVQNEMLRSLLFLYVVQGDDLDLSDVTIERSARRVAVLLGLGESARRSAERRLMGAYADIRANALRSIATLSLKIARHLGRVSTFRKVVETGDIEIPGDIRAAASSTKSQRNLALHLLETLEQHKSGVFWDEVVELVGAQVVTRDRFFDGLASLGLSKRRMVVRGYVEMMIEDAASMIELLVLAALHDRDKRDRGEPASSPPHARLFWWAMMRLLARDRQSLELFVSRLDTETRSEALFRLATAYTPTELAALANFVERAEVSPRGARVARAVRSVIILVHHSSNALSRLSVRVLGRTPDFLQRLGDTRRLKDLASEISQRAAREPNPREQIELLGDAFDVAALRAALIAILEATPQARDIEYTGAVDEYVRALFKACFREVRARSPMFDRYRPGTGIAIYATGSYARGEAFGADWDYIAVIDHDESRALGSKEADAMKKFFGKVLQLVGQAMARRGLLPHNRFTDRFNTYVLSVSELESYFATRDSETFIDEAEVLEARFFLGDPAVARAFNERVWTRVAKTNRDDFMKDLLGEIRNRRERPPLGFNIKLGPGGLREIHLTWLLIRLHAELPGPLAPALLPLAEKALPKVRADLRYLTEANEELRRARDLYRLAVAFDDHMEPEILARIAKDLEPLKRAGVREPYRDKLAKLMQEVARRVDRVADAIEG